jgi:hypothetical protein
MTDNITFPFKRREYFKQYCYDGSADVMQSNNAAIKHNFSPFSPYMELRVVYNLLISRICEIRQDKTLPTK